MNQLNVDCCNSTGVVCTLGRVTSIKWESMNLAGTINSSAIPNALVTLSLLNNGIGGSISGYPSTLQTVDFCYNKISGPMPPFHTNLIKADYCSNLFIGTIPRMNDKLEFLNLWNCVGLYGNIEYFPNKLRHINVAGNYMNGTLPYIPRLLAQLYLYNNDFTGSIVVYQPTQLHLEFNYFSFISICDTTKLQFCDLTNNLIYSDTVANLTGKCTGILTRSASAMAVATKLTENPDYCLDSTISSTFTSTSHDFTTAFMVPNLTTQSASANIENTNTPISLLDLSFPVLAAILFGIFILLFIGLLLAKRYLKSPQINSKFARRHSDGTLMTVASRKQ